MKSKHGTSRVVFVGVLSLLLVAASAEVFAGGASETPPATSTQTQGTAFQSDPNLNPPGVIPIAKDKVTLTLGFPVTPQITDIDTNYQTLLLEERGNFDLVFEMFPANEMSQKVQLMMAAGGADLPDVLIGGLSESASFTYGAAGMIIPLNDYYEHSCFFIKTDFLEKTDVDVLRMVTAPDGNIYGIPTYNQSLSNELATQMWIYGPWLDALGGKKPNTVDDLESLLKKIKTSDLNGNGKSDEIPLVGWRNSFMGAAYDAFFDFLMTPFIYASSPNYWRAPLKTFISR